MNGNTSFEQEIEEQDELGQLIVLKKDGIDSGCYPLLDGTGPWKIGQNEDCDLRVRLPGVIGVHAKISKEDVEETFKFKLSSFGPVYINGAPTVASPSKLKVEKTRTLRHKDMIGILGRQFRIEYPNGHPMTERRKRRSSISLQKDKDSSLAKSPRSRDSLAIARVKHTPNSMIRKRQSEGGNHRKTTRVTFGNQLSPEIFDYRRPPATPIRKGATPLRCDGGRRSIIKATPLKVTRETVEKLDLTSSFQLSPSPEPEPKPRKVKIQENDNIMKTPEKTPSERRASRRRSSLFKPKEAKEDKPVDEKKSKSTPTKESRRRTIGSGSTPKRQNIQSRLKRLSGNPEELERLIRMYGNAVPRAAVIGRQIQAGKKVKEENDENKENDTTADIAKITASPKPSKQLPLPKIGPMTNHDMVANRVETPSSPLTPKIDSVMNIRQQVDDKLKNNPDLVQSCETPASKFAREFLEETKNKSDKPSPVTTQDMMRSKSPHSLPFELSLDEAEYKSSNMSVDTVDLLPNSNVSTPKSTEVSALLESTSEDVGLPKPIVEDATAEVSSTSDNLFENDESTVEPTAVDETKPAEADSVETTTAVTPAPATVTLASTAVTPGPTAMKKLFDDHKQEMATPNQAAMKTLFSENKNEIQTPNQTAMKTIFAQEKQTKTPSHVGVREIFHDKQTNPQTPDQSTMKRLFENEKQTKTPSHVGIKEIFLEEKQSNSTPDQSAMKKVFRQEVEQEMNTPDQSAMKKCFEANTEHSSKTPDQSAIKKLFADQNAQTNTQTPGQTAMKGLFAEAKASNPNQTLAPDDGSVERIFGTPAKTFEHYVTPKKTPNPFDADVKINWASTVVNNVVISSINFDDEEDAEGIDILFNDAVQDNYLLAGLFAENCRKSSELDETLDLGELMTEVLFGENAQPIQIDLDDEVSISTACLIKHVAKTRRGPPPSASKLVRSTRRTRSMDRISPPRTEQSSSTPLVRSRARRSIRKTTRTEEDDTLAVAIDDAATDDIPDEVLPLPTDDSKPEVTKEAEEPEETAKTNESPVKEVPEPVIEEIAPSRPKRAQPKAKAATATRKRRVVQPASGTADEEKTSPVKEASPKAKRATRSKAAAKAIKLIDADNEEKEEEPKPTRRTRKTTQTNEEAAPVKKTTRQKKPSKDSETEQAVDSNEAPAEQPKKTRRGRSARTTEKTETVEQEVVTVETESQPTSPLDESDESPKKSVKKTKAKKQSKKSKMIEAQNRIVANVKKETRKRIEDGDEPEPAPEVIMEKVSTKSSIRKAAKGESKKVKFPEDPEETPEESEQAEEEPKPAKTTRARKAKAVVEEDTTKPAPKRSTRRKQEEPTLEESPPKKVSKTRTRKTSKDVPEVTEEKKVVKKTRAKKATKVEEAEEVEVKETKTRTKKASKEEVQVEVEVPAEKPKRGRKAKVAVAKDTSPVARKTRSRK